MASDAQGIPLIHSDGGLYLIAVDHAYYKTPPTHVAHALDATSVAARREAAIEAIQRNNLWPAEMIDAIARAWGLDHA